MSRTVLFGLSREGGVLHTEALTDSDHAVLRKIAEDRLRLFHSVEVWVESVRLVRLRRTKT